MPLDTKSSGPNAGRDLPVVWAVPEALQQLVECGDTELVDELIAIFQSDTAERLQALGGAVASGDYAEVRAQAHTVKGSAMQVGANRVGEICRQMEIEAKKSPPLELDWLLNRLRKGFAEACAAMAARTGSTGKPPAL